MFDSGVGGLTVLRELKACLPNAKFIYFGDTARTPRGCKGPETIMRYAGECADFLSAQGITKLVLACNTVSSYALAELQIRCGSVPVFPTIDPAAEADFAARAGGLVSCGDSDEFCVSDYAHAFSALVTVYLVPRWLAHADFSGARRDRI